MRRDYQIALAERLLQLVERGKTDMGDAPYERDASAYCDPVRFEREKTVFFRRTPLWAGFSSDLTKPGDFLTHDDTGVPILIVRKQNGTLAAYANICRHRGARLVNEVCAKGRGTFSCPYHGWTYNDEGRLVGIPYKEGFEGVTRTARGLTPMPVAEKFGMIFVSGTPDEKIDLDAHLGPLGPEFESWGVGNVHPVFRRSMNVPINWKLALDTYAEGYHFSILHRNTIAQLSHTNVMAYDRFAPHYRLCFPSLTIQELRTRAEESWEPLDYMSLVYYLFPNVSLNITGTKRRTARVFRILPGENVAHSTTIHCAYSFQSIENDSMRDAFMRHFDYMHSVIRDEDYAVGIGVQNGLASGLPTTFVFGRNEPSLIHMHKEYDRVLAESDSASGEFTAGK